jgi:hypothetical protein
VTTCSLLATPEPMLLARPHDNRVVQWVAAGQDGQQTWLLTDDGAAVSAEHLPPDDGIVGTERGARD